MGELMTTSHTFFATPGLLTAAGSRADLLDPLPHDIKALVQIVQGLMIHVFWAERYGVQVSTSRQAELQLRSLSRKLERILELDSRPLDQAREPEKRLVGNCRDFSVLLTGMLRHQGVPARARCGFARYFIPNHFEDHWVCEYWHAGAGRWILVDAQLDALHRDVLNLDFDPLDVPRDQFIVGGQAWQMCRAGQADPDTFGIGDLKGLWFVRGDFVRDVTSLNKLELLPWDSWGLIEGGDEELSEADLAALDAMAELTAGDMPEFDRMRQVYESDRRWCVPSVIRSYGADGAKLVELAAA